MLVIRTDAAFVERTADVERPAVLLPHDDSALRNVLAPVQDPGGGTPRSASPEVVSATLRLREPLVLRVKNQDCTG